MKTMFKNSATFSFLTCIVVTMALTGCRSDSDRTVGQRMSDRQVSRAVASQLSDDPTFKYTDVDANVYNGDVQLTGFVETPEQRLRAAELASRTKGVREVVNEIQIKPPSSGPALIRDPLAAETNAMLLDTNAPVTHLRNMSEATEQQK